MALGAAVAAAATPAAALAGGWATAGVAPPPADTKPGKPWNAELTLLQHGRTPLEGVKPSVIISPARGGSPRTFAAKPTGEPGKYVARVVFPAAGRWTYAVDDGFSARHEFALVTIGGAASTAPVPGAAAREPVPAGDDGGGPGVWLALGLAGAAGLVAGLAMLLLRRRRDSGAAAPAGG
jgi:hypothetical protein